MVRAGKSDIEIVDELPGPWFKYNRSLDKLRCIFAEKETRDINVELYWGISGSGKTRKATEDNPDYFMLNGPWFDGYTGQNCLIIDDFRSWLPMHLMKRLLDRYILYVDVKGSRVPARWTKCVITSNHNVEDWWPNSTHTDEDKNAIRRRIHKTTHFNII